MSESEILEGTLDKIVFKNENGFMIGSFIDKNSNPFTALGSMINPEIGLNYIVTGTWQNDARFGDQLKFHSYETILPVDNNGIFKYIVRICKFVGPKVGTDIVDLYGEDTLRMLKENPIMVSIDIKGITPERAKEIQAVLLENEANEKIMIELETLLDIPGMRKNLPGELIKKYKSNAAEMVKDNPYILTFFRGVSFILADRVALNIGFPRDSVERKKAATKHVLSENMNQGNIWIYENELILEINALIQVPNLKEGLESLIDEGVVIKENHYLAFETPAFNEMMIAEKIIKMVNFKK